MNQFERVNLPTAETSQIKERMMLQPSFIRFIKSLETYQNLLSDDNLADTDAVKKRMISLFQPKETSEDTETPTAVRELFEMVNLALRECENHSFNKDEFAENLARTSAGELFLKQTSWQAGETEPESGMIHLNNPVAYKEENDGWISVHIRPSNTNTSELVREIKAGFQLLADKLHNGEVKADNINMTSWLFDPKREKLIQAFFGGEIKIDELADDNKEAEAVQQLALLYNSQSLRSFLLTGEKPKVRQVEMSKEDFMASFGS